MYQNYTKFVELCSKSTKNDCKRRKYSFIKDLWCILPRIYNKNFEGQTSLNQNEFVKTIITSILKLSTRKCREKNLLTSSYLILVFSKIHLLMIVLLAF